MVVHWVHVVSAVLWVGGGIVSSLLILPVLTALPPADQRRIGRAIATRMNRFYPAVAGVTFLFGLIRLLLVGYTTGWDRLIGTPYGHTWMTALVLTLLLMVLGARFTGPTSLRMYSDDSLWRFGPGEAPPAGLMAHVQLLRTLSLIEIAGFAVVIFLMVLMHFGL
ncbi:MAG: hypothetical protein AVDCRST_MAG77-2006 [uncultured Chloroflexi bacterium]|uniref:Copper resistance protein D domain-containing protein n=1 Tax=uncultured Chloroflexota bacterium TaxID=166587 RepID=A0A6J4GYB5_9CHLR|nr:MAG: hypothetical protein AVDCRST_MAG77-2006 [uncultured Chloroflexota bacterium]